VRVRLYYLRHISSVIQRRSRTPYRYRWALLAALAGIAVTVACSTGDGGRGSTSAGGSVAGGVAGAQVSAGSPADAGRGGAVTGGAGSGTDSGGAGYGGAGQAGAVSDPAGAGGTSGAGGSVSGGSSGTSGTSVTTPTRFGIAFSDTIIARWPDPRNIAGVARGWDYNNGIVLRGMQAMFEKTRDARYRNYIKRYVDYFLDSGGNLYVDAMSSQRIEAQPHSLDLIQPAALLLFLAEQYPTEGKYRLGADRVRSLFTAFPVNADGGFWHKQTYPNEMWLDGIYMAGPFLAKYGASNAACGAYCADTAVAQTTLISRHVLLPSGLLRHGWDADRNAVWCTGACQATGVSAEVWSRGLGWYAMALVDMLEWLPPAHAGRAALIALLEGIAAGVKSAQDPATGLWCQVVDKCDRSDNWLEASGSAMLVYALKRGADRGHLDPAYLAVAGAGWAGLRAHMIGTDALGPTINDSAEGMSIQATYADYVARPKTSNFYHGLCAIQLAASVMED